MSLPALIGMVHLGPLPGSPNFGGDIDRIVESAIADAKALSAAGFDALMIENFGDAPFYPDSVPAETIAGITRVVTDVRSVTDLPLGVNVLRNDALGALAVAAATGASMIRVNVLSSMMYTDQGPIVGRAADVGRARARLAPDVLILADVFVKHAAPPPGMTLEQTALDTWERAGADALVVSGTGTGAPVEIDDLDRVRAIVPDAPIVIGSGASVDTIETLARHADAVIVGSSIKSGGDVTRSVDSELAAQFVQSARFAGLGD